MMQKPWWRSLQVKIIGWSFVPTVIILSAVAWFTFYSYQKVIGDLAIRQDSAIVQLKTQPIFQAFVSVGQHIIIPIILNIDINLEEPLADRAQKILDQAQNLDVFDGGVYFVDHQGIVYKTRPEQPELLGQDWSNTPHFLFIQGHPGRAAHHDLLDLGTGGKKILCTSISMNGPQGEFVGASYYCLTFSPLTQNTFYTALLDLNLDPNLILLDGNNRVIFSADPAEIGRDLSGEAYLQQLLQGQDMSGRFRKGNEDVLVSYAAVYPYPDINLNRWKLIKVETWTDVMRPSLPYRQLLLVLLLLGVAVPVLVTLYGVRHITEPIQKLIKASEQVTAGHFKQQIEVKTGDQIETLADQFNLMSAELDESYASLEKKVADRTRELAILNSIISVASHSLNIQEILEDALSNTVEQMGFAMGVAFKLEPHPNPPLVIAHRGFEPTTAVDLVRSYAAASQGTAAAFPEDVIVFGMGDIQDEKLRNQLSPFGFQLLVYIPLSTKGSQLGFFILGKHEPDPLSPEEHSLLRSIGRQVGVAMENARLYEQAEQTAITAERGRLARELHDAVTQTLFSANLIADVLPRIWERNPEEGLQNLEELRQMTRGALAEMRTLLLEMRPESLERVDLKTLLTQLVEAFIGRVRIPVALEIQGGCELSHEVKLVFYRVAQEALNNIAKHSGARQVAVHLECQPDHMVLRIIDDGLGFDPRAITPDHLGMAIMHERAGSIGAQLKVESQVGQGTKVELDWGSVKKEASDGDA